jgi:hypothetical protein
VKHQYRAVELFTTACFAALWLRHGCKFAANDHTLSS